MGPPFGWGFGRLRGFASRTRGRSLRGARGAGDSHPSINFSRRPAFRRKRFESSPIATRPFCTRCGTSLGFQFNDSDQMDLAVGAFDDPKRFRPTANYGAESINRHFLDASRLPEKTTADIASVTDRWVKATGSFPG